MCLNAKPQNFYSNSPRGTPRMLRIAALNDEVSEDSSADDEVPQPTKEAEEADCLRLYNEALQFRQRKEFDSALNLFLQILSLPTVEKAIKENNDSEEQINLSSILQLKYACLKNVGALYNQKKDRESALDAYLEALEIEYTDVTIWFTIGDICIQLTKYQLARHAFDQGLVCSPNHWPCLDGLIKVLFALGDDVACLFHINKALQKDSMYLMGLVARDIIFQELPSLRTDIKSLQPEISWSSLFMKSEYTDDEWKATSEAALSLRSKTTAIYDPQLASCTQPLRLSSITSWADVGRALLKMHQKIMEGSDNLKLSRAVGFELEYAIEDTTNSTPDKVESEDVEMTDVQAENLESEKKDSELNADVTADENASVAKPQEDVEAQDVDVPAKIELPEKQDSRKRKRSMEQCHLQLKETQRRSTRSRAYAQQAEEEIYSLRAELRSYLPTALLLSDQSDNKIKPENEIELETAGITPRPSLEPEAEQSGAFEFISAIGCSKSTIIEILRKFCTSLATLESNSWSKELNDVYRESYILVRSQVCGPEVFSAKGIETLIFCEIFLSFQRTENFSTNMPAWFNQDLAFLFQLADPLVSSPSRETFSFQARTFWVHFCWHFQTGQLDEARHYLSMVYNCLYSLHEESDAEGYTIHSHAYDTFSSFGIVQVNQLMQMLQRTLQLADVAKLHQERDHKQVVDILKAALKDSKASKQTHAPINRPSQWSMLLKSLSSLEDYDDFVVWSERCLNESIAEYLLYFANKSNAETECSDASPDKQHLADWTEIIQIVSTELEEVLRTKRSTLGTLNHNALVRLAENLVLICSHQLEWDSSNKLPLSSTIFWILLHRMIEFEEIRSRSHKASSPQKEGVEAAPLDDVDDGLSCSTLFLMSAHDLLGKRSWCMHQNGIFVLYLLEVLVRRRRTASEPEDLEELGRAIEQATFCALGYPTSKKMKNKTFCDHGGSSVELTWNIALQVAEYYLPGRQDVPEFDTMKPYSNAEQEALYKKIVGLIPPELDPKNRIEDVEDFIQGRRPNIPKYLLHSGMPRQAENLFYLLADYYFKNKEWAKAIENYTLDLVLVPDRFDSWAALALATGSRLETKVNSCERMKNAKSFLDRAETALRCYRRALSLRPTHTTLWIEQGSTAYMLHSFCSQLLRNETDSFNIQMFERLEKEKERMLDIANGCFLAADKSWLAEVEKDKSVDQDERWLHHYMLGKVAEKRAKSFDEYIGYYQKAAQLLEESSAAYPKKISYNTPGHLSVEALEIHYRIHSSCLKVLMTLERKQIDVELCRKVLKQLEIANKGAFVTFGKKPEAKQDFCEKEGIKRKAVKHEDEKPSKKSVIESNEVNQLEGRGATIHEVNLILNEILERVVSMSKAVCSDQPASIGTEIEVKTLDSSAQNSAQATESAACTSSVSEQKPVDISSNSTSSSDTDDESDSSSPAEASDSKAEASTVAAAPVELPAESIPDLQSMIDSCLTAIKECVSRFPHFYKGTYRLAHYYYHSKTKRNLEACRELLLGRALSPSLALLQQQQGMMQPRYLPVGIGGLFNEWRSNNFFHGIWRIPINEIDRPGCFAYHMGRSITLLIDVLRETRDHRLLMELALALQPEPEPDKKYLYDSEREQQASLATSLVLQVLRSRLQELKESNLADVNSDSHYSSPQQTSPSTSKKLSLLMDVFRTYDRMERNLPGQGAAFTSILVDTYKQYRNSKDLNANEESLLEQALEFCRNKQAQSRARITGTRGGISSSANTVSARGKRVSTGSRRGRLPTFTQPAVVRESNLSASSSSLTNPPTAPAPSHSSVMQEAMKLLQSAGGSAENLPQHLKNIPGISNLLALFKTAPEPQALSNISVPKPDSQPERSESKKESSNQKSSTPSRPVTSSSAPVSSASLPTPVSTSTPTTSSAASSLLGFPTTGIPNLGFLDPNMLAMLANPYVNPLSMFTSPLLGSDAATLSKLQQEYQQQLMNSMQTALAQSYVMSSLANPFLPTARSRGRGGRKPTPRTPEGPKPSQAVDMSKTKATPAAEQPSTGSSSSAGASAMDLSTYGAKLPKPLPKRSSEAPSQPSPKPSASRTDLHPRPSGSSLPLDLKLPPPHFEDALKGIKPHPSSEPKKASGSQPEAPKGKQPSQSTISPQLPKTSFTPIDVAKFLSELPPSLDLKRLPKSDKRQSLPSTLRGRSDDLKPGPSSVSSTNKTSSGAKHLKTPSVSFPINLGKEITLTATSSSKGAFPMPPKPVPKPRSQGASGVPHLSPSASMTPGFAHASKHDVDPLNLGYSILQNLPSSMSLLVKPTMQNQDKGATSARDLVVPKKVRSVEQAIHMPKLTPAPQQAGSKKGKSTQIARPPNLHTNASLPPPYLQGGNLMLPSTVQKGNSTQPNQPVDKSQKKDSSKQPDIVTLD